MRVLFVTSEVAPYSKTGGLGDVCGALPAALAARGHQLRVVSPLYRDVPRSGLQRFGEPLRLSLPVGTFEVQTYRLEAEGVEQVFLDVPSLYDRASLYGFRDDAIRFAVLSTAALSTAQRDRYDADVVHANDWTTGLSLLALKSGFAHTRLGLARRIFTIHNLAYQGNFPKKDMETLGIPWNQFKVEGVEFYDRLSFMKAALVSADMVTTVSPSYAQEIQTPQFGVGLDGVLRLQADRLCGILNGVDTRLWDPATDVFLPANYTALDLSGRARCRAELLASCQLTPPTQGMPLFGVISRMVEQKGTDLLQLALPAFLDRGACVTVLGSGEAQLEDGWRALAQRYPRQVSLRLGFDESLAHRIEAGSDFFLMPSRFEPCGLNQMYSLRYGCVPIVHGVGGLKDTVVDMAESQGNGLVFHQPTVPALVSALARSVELFRQPERYAGVQKMGMKVDFGWGRPAEAYEEIYRLTS